MKLIELIEVIDSISDDQIIFITTNVPIYEDIESLTGPIQQNAETGETPIGMEYFLEVPLAKEVLAVWEKWRNGRKPTLKEKYQALVYYATKDAYIPTE